MPPLLTELQQRMGHSLSPRWDPAIQFAISAARGARHAQSTLARLGDVRDHGRSHVAELALPPEMRGWDFGRKLQADIISGLLGGPNIKASAAQVRAQPVFAKSAELGWMPPVRPGYQRDAAERRFALLITYFWMHLGRKPLTARQLYDLAFGLGVAGALEDPERTWRKLVRDVKRALASFVPSAAPPANIQDPDLLDLYAVAEDMTYDPAVGRHVCSRPDHRELVDYAIRTQPVFDAAAYAHGVAG
jgi:hypothetical protein